MKPLNPTEMPPLVFDEEAHQNGGKVLAQSGKIGWIRSFSDAPGAKFDLVIKDGLGRTKFEKRNCSSETEQFGELVNLHTFLGEELDVRIENVRGAKKINVFLN